MAPSEAVAVRLAPQAQRRLVLLTVLLLWLGVTLPVALGWETLHQRDVFTTALHLKAFGAQELAQGRIPAFNPRWGLGLPFRGNPNALAFYPGNLLYLVLPFWSAFNLHYMLHWLLAFVGFAALARRLGLSADASLLAAMVYGGSGWMLSTLTFYNLLTVAAWWPLVLLGAVVGGRRGVAVGGIACGLALLGGEPLTAALGLVPLIGLAIRHHGGRGGLVTATAIGALGLAIALPQVVATARVIDYSYRFVHGVDLSSAGVFSLHPLRLVEWLVPLPFGQPDGLGAAGYWARRLAADLPWTYSLHFGVVGLVLAAAGARRSRRWVGLAVLGVALAICGRLAPDAMVGLSAGLFRHPEKLLFWTYLALPVIAGRGLDGMAQHRRPAMRTALGVALLALALVPLALAFGDGWIGWLAPRLDAAGVAAVAAWQIPAWVFALTLTAAIAAAAAWACRQRSAGLLLTLQLLALLPLGPLLATDSTAPYRRPAAWATGLPPGARVLSATYDSALRPRGTLDPEYTLAVDSTRAALRRIGHLDLDFPTGMGAGLSYPLVPDLEGLQTPFAPGVYGALRGLGAEGRRSWLRALGVQAVTATGDPPAAGLRRLSSTLRRGVPTHLYAVHRPAPPVWWPREVVVAASPRQGLRSVTAAADAVAQVVVPRAVVHRSGGRVREVSSAPDRIEIEVESDGGVVALLRQYHPLLAAESDGQRLATLPVNVLLLGVEVPPGRHRVVVSVSALPEQAACLAALVALIGAAVVAAKGASAAPPASGAAHGAAKSSAPAGCSG